MWQILIFSFLLQSSQIFAAQMEWDAFSAETFQQTPDGGRKQGRIFVQGDYVRTEQIDGEDELIRLFDTAKGVSYQLIPRRKEYREMPYHSVAFARKSAATEVNPCNGLTGASCEKGAAIKISGRDALEWDIVITQGDEKYRMKQWIDTQRGMLLRYVAETGEYSDMRLLRNETLGGRKVEKWEMTVGDGKNAPQKIINWFDVELNMAIREEHENGAIREMRNIRIGAQDPQLFIIPEGYQIISAD